MSSIHSPAAASLLHCRVPGRGFRQVRILPRFPAWFPKPWLGSESWSGTKTIIITIFGVMILGLAAEEEPKRALDLPLEMQRFIQIRDREIAEIESKFLQAVRELRAEMREKKDTRAVRQLDMWLAQQEKDSDPILGAWIFQQEGNPGRRFFFGEDGTWTGASPAAGSPFGGRWERRGNLVILWKTPNSRGSLDPSKPIAELTVDVEGREVQWKPLQGSVKQTGKRPSAPVNSKQKNTDSIFKVE